MRGRAVVLALFLLAGVLTAIQYDVTTGYGFYYDDYHFVRPYTAHEVLAAFHGPWDASGIETAYYRPLTIALYAARFSLFGLNSAAYHVLSLVLFAMAATLFAMLAMRMTGSRLAGAIGVCVFVMHPAMPYSAVAWITNQMHLAGMLVVLIALLWWFSVRWRSAIWWTPLLVLQVAAFLIKEDGVMLLPVVITVHTLRKYLVEGDLPHVPVTFLASTIATLGLLFLVRNAALEGAPPRRFPPFDAAWTNLVRGFSGPFFLTPVKRAWQPAASWFAILVPAAAVVAWRWMSPAVRFGIAAGVLLGALFDLPFIFIVKAASDVEKRKSTAVNDAIVPGTSCQPRARVQPGAGVERRERLVEQQQLGLRGEGAGERDPLCLASAQLARLFPYVIGQTHPPQPLPGLLARFPARHAPAPGTEGHVVERGEVREEQVILEDHADPAVLGRFPVEPGAVQRDVPVVEAGQPGQRAQRRGLARAVGPEQRHHLAGRDRQRDVQGEPGAPHHETSVQHHAATHRSRRAARMPTETTSSTRLSTMAASTSCSRAR